MTVDEIKYLADELKMLRDSRGKGIYIEYKYTPVSLRQILFNYPSNIRNEIILYIRTKIEERITKIIEIFEKEGLTITD